MNVQIEYKESDPNAHLTGGLALCEAESWWSFTDSSEIARKSLTAPGVTTLFATVPDERSADEGVVGFAQAQGDGLGLQRLSLLAVEDDCVEDDCVEDDWRRTKVARKLVKEGFRRLGAARMDRVDRRNLIASGKSLELYRPFRYGEQVGFRLCTGSRPSQREAT